MSSRRTWGMACLLVAALAGMANAAVIYVSAASGNDANDGLSWATAKASVGAGLSTSVSGDQVWGAAGTYVENITLKGGVGLFGGFVGNEDPATFDLADRDFAANETILDGNANGSVVIAPQGATETTRIDGFTIRNGSASYGGGIYCAESFLTIANNTITGNTVSFRGGGIYCPDGSPTITDNTIMGNNALDGGGIYCGEASRPTIVHNKITGNSAPSAGGGMYCSAFGATIASNTIIGNTASRGGGLYCYLSLSTISNNTITGNIASQWGGGIGCQTSWDAITNNTITGNVTFQLGGGIFCDSSPTIANNTITGNHGHGIYCGSSSRPTIANTIVAYNSSGILAGSAVPILRHNCVFGNAAYDYSGIADPTGTDGNISVDPKLADPAYGNVHIQPNSPCVNAGDNSYALGDYDIDGQLRIQPAGGTVDIGADESDGTLWPEGPYVIVRVSPDGDDANDGSSWAQAKQTVQAGVDGASLLGGDVWVRAGTYHERITLHPYAHLHGGFAGTEQTRDERDWVTNTTTLDGQAGGGVVTVRAGAQVSTIDGFTIRNGSASYGGGIHCSRASPTIANNTITGNSAEHNGGGLYCYYSASMICNNTIAGNTTFVGDGGGIHCELSSPKIINNTITGNTSVYGSGGAMRSGGGVPTIANTIVAFNSSGIYVSYYPGQFPWQHNCVFGNGAYNYRGTSDPTGTNGNISADPAFVRNPDPGPDGVWGTADDDFGDLRLQSGSPCIDAGENAAVPPGVTADLGGNARIINCLVDMGAFEANYGFPSPFAADFDHDCDVDLADFAQFAGCFNGPNRPPAAGCGADADFDGDIDVDLADFATFSACFNGPNRPPAAGCP